jgi:site-specific DNA recombinase
LAEQARIVELLVERVDVQENALEVRIRAEGLASLVGELQQQGERKAA